MTYKQEEFHLRLSHGQASRLVAAALIVMVCIFVAGYYLGKKGHGEELAECVKRDAFADHVYSSLSALYGTDFQENDDREYEK